MTTPFTRRDRLFLTALLLCIAVESAVAASVSELRRATGTHTTRTTPPSSWVGRSRQDGTESGFAIGLRGRSNLEIAPGAGCLVGRDRENSA